MSHGDCRALEKTGVEADAVTYVNAHATSTPAGDLAEYRAIRTVFPGKHLRMNATKSMTGHLLGAAGAIEAIACVQAIRTGELVTSQEKSSCSHTVIRANLVRILKD